MSRAPRPGRPPSRYPWQGFLDEPDDNEHQESHTHQRPQTNFSSLTAGEPPELAAKRRVSALT